MVAKGRDPLFLERSGYRRRRGFDAIRLLAFAGAALWMMPLLWPDGSAPDAEPAEAAVSMSSALFFIFGVWVVLILMSAVLSLGKMLPEEGTAAEMRKPPS